MTSTVTSDSIELSVHKMMSTKSIEQSFTCRVPNRAHKAYRTEFNDKYRTALPEQTLEHAFKRRVPDQSTGTESDEVKYKYSLRCYGTDYGNSSP